MDRTIYSGLRDVAEEQMSYALRRLTPEQYRGWLSSRGLHGRGIEDVLSGFDLDQPLIEECFEAGERLFQYIRGGSLANLSPGVGSWFARAGATPSALAILEGLAGRRLHRFSVVATFTSIEGTAARFRRNVMLDLGGKGGTSQIFIPSMYRGYLRAIGAQERW